MQNPLLKFWQSFIISKKLGDFSEKLKTLTSSNYQRVQYFCCNFAHVSCVPMSTKACSGIFYFVSGFCECVETMSFFLLANNARSIQNKKIPNSFLQTLVSRKRVQNFSKKILNSMAVRARDSFQFFRQITWFLENNRACLNFCVGLISIKLVLISITKLYKKNQSIKPNFV